MTERDLPLRQIGNKPQKLTSGISLEAIRTMRLPITASAISPIAAQAEEYVGDLGSYLFARYFSASLTAKAVARDIVELSNGAVDVGGITVSNWLKQYGYPTRTKEETWKDQAVREGVVQRMKDSWQDEERRARRIAVRRSPDVRAKINKGLREWLEETADVRKANRQGVIKQDNANIVQRAQQSGLLGVLSEIEQTILQDRYLTEKPLSFAQLKKKHSLSRQRISEKEAEALRRLRTILGI
ncbi:hypothetical protein HY383_02670 [Candidatus Daviesbacteria bacterium]|nr:hypothetical protein [Candidatus Daviesbacteria bacterium]